MVLKCGLWFEVSVMCVFGSSSLCFDLVITFLMIGVLLVGASGLRFTF